MSVEVVSTPVPEADPKAAVRENEKKWGKTLMDAGWTCIPSTIILHQQALGLDPVDMNIVLVIAAHWWKADQLAFPSKKLIADTIGKDPTTVRRRLARLEKDGLIQRIFRPQPGGRHNSNEYRLSGLITGAEPLARQELAKRDQNTVLPNLAIAEVDFAGPGERILIRCLAGSDQLSFDAALHHASRTASIRDDAVRLHIAKLHIHDERRSGVTWIHREIPGHLATSRPRADLREL